MDILYPFFIAFLLIFLSELGDKTQLLVLSFSTKLKSYTILLGVALGSFLSHGIAILFGSALGSFENFYVQLTLKFLTYFSFLFFGFLTLFPKKDTNQKKDTNKMTNTLSHFHLGYLMIIAISIAIGELGDKTFLASLGLGIQYPTHKFFLILGAILGMVASDTLAIIFGKLLSHKISDRTINILSGTIFLLFGILGIIHLFVILL